MLDLDSLFAASPAPLTVPKHAQPSPSGKTANKSHSGGGAPAGVTIQGTANKSAESLEPSDTKPDSTRPAGGEVGHSGNNRNPHGLGEVCPPKPLPHKEFDGLGTAGTVGTLEIQGGERRSRSESPGGGAARNEFALHPAAVVLVLAYCRKVRATGNDKVSALLHLEAMPPGEQIRCWHSACVDVGLKPWEVLMLPAPSSGLDCTMCKHLTTRQIASDGGRRQFNWACGLGYLILETGRATERIWIAPPECSSWERWRPGLGR